MALFPRASYFFNAPAISPSGLGRTDRGGDPSLPSSRPTFRRVCGSTSTRTADGLGIGGPSRRHIRIGFLEGPPLRIPHYTRLGQELGGIEKSHIYAVMFLDELELVIDRLDVVEVAIPL